MINTLEEALRYIAELEEENKVLREEVEKYKSRKSAGRKKHNEAWRSLYNDFAAKHEEMGKNLLMIIL